MKLPSSELPHDTRTISSQSTNEQEVSICVHEIEDQQQKRSLNEAVSCITSGRYSPLLSTLNASWDDISRTINVLKDNSLHADLGGGTLYGIVVEKLPENLLKDYYRWIKERGKNETMETLNEWAAMEVDLQTQASEVTHGFTRKYEASKWSRRDGKNTKSYSTSLQDGKKTGNEIERKGKPCRACGEAHHLKKC